MSLLHYRLFHQMLSSGGLAGLPFVNHQLVGEWELGVPSFTWDFTTTRSGVGIGLLKGHGSLSSRFKSGHPAQRHSSKLAQW